MSALICGDIATRIAAQQANQQKSAPLLLTTPKITVIVALLNAGRHLERCISSVADQSYAGKELVIIDGGSTDGSLETLRCHQGNISFWVSEPDAGISAAWNKGIAHATGDWFCFQGADDNIRDSGVFERMAAHLAGAYPQFRVVYGKVNVVSADGATMGVFGRPWAETRPDFIAGNALYIHQAMFLHRSLFDSYGGFDESFQIAADYELLLRELKSRDALYVPETVAVMQHGGRSSNPASKPETIKEVIRARRKNGLTAGELALQSALLRAWIHAMLHRVAGRRVSALVADGYRLMVGKERLWTRGLPRGAGLGGGGRRRDQ